MGKADVTMVFDSDTAAYVQNIQRATNAYLANASGVRQMGQSTESAGQTMIKFAGALGIVTTAVGAVSLGAEAMKTGFNNYMESMKERAEALLGKIVNINEALAASGQESMSAEVRMKLAAMGTIGGQPVNPTIQADMFNKIARSDAGRLLGADDKVAATRAAYMSFASGSSQEDATQVGTIFAQLKQVQALGGFKGQTNQQLADKAASAFEIKPEGFAGRDLQILSRFGDADKGLQYVEAGKISGQISRAVSSVQQQADELSHGNEDRADQLIADWMSGKKRAPAQLKSSIDMINKGQEELARRPVQTQQQRIGALTGSGDVNDQRFVASRAADAATQKSIVAGAGSDLDYQTRLAKNWAVERIIHPDVPLSNWIGWTRFQTWAFGTGHGSTPQDVFNGEMENQGDLSNDQLKQLKEIGITLSQTQLQQLKRSDTSMQSGHAGN